LCIANTLRAASPTKEFSMKCNRSSQRPLRLEVLEPRLVLSPLASYGESEYHSVIVAGDPTGTPADSPSKRIDPNTTSSPFAGVGSLQIDTRRGTYICSATPISSTHVLTAGHCVDINNDGKSTSKDGIRGITFNLNYGGNLTHGLDAAQWFINPEFTGFARPSVNDDLAIIRLGTALPAGVPVYPLYANPLTAGTIVTLVGYGQSGDGVSGYYVNASFSVKRSGKNAVDAFYTEDDGGGPVQEVARLDFDGPTGNGTFGGPTLGNTVETTLGGGDSGGPGFVQVGSNFYLAVVNTFTQGFSAPRFGSLGGGIAVPAYASWIQSILSGSGSPASGTPDGGPRGGRPPDNALIPLIAGVAAGASETVPVALRTQGASGPVDGPDAVTFDGHPARDDQPAQLEWRSAAGPTAVRSFHALQLPGGDHRVATDQLFASSPWLPLAWDLNPLTLDLS
jgi:hypothetical protein